MAAGFAPPRGDGQAASASRFAALMRIVVVFETVSNLRALAPRKARTAFVSRRQETASVAVTVKSSPATSERPRALNSSLSAASSASAPFTMASARPIASARASLLRLWKRETVLFLRVAIHRTPFVRLWLGRVRGVVASCPSDYFLVEDIYERVNILYRKKIAGKASDKSGPATFHDAARPVGSD